MNNFTRSLATYLPNR